MSTRAVYTALLGRYEALAEQPVAASSDLAFVCFTDDRELRSDTWEVRLVEPLFELDPVRSARALKLTGHADLSAFTETLWIDARVRLVTDPAGLLDSWLDGSDIAVARHSFRADVVSEFEEVLLMGLDEHSRLYEQLSHYTALAPDLLEAPVPWTALLARRRTPEVQRAMEGWLWHVVRYSRRDQLSFVHAMARAGAKPRLVAIDNLGSAHHEWLGGDGRSNRPAVSRMSESLRPPTAKLGELRRDLERTTVSMLKVVQAREARIAELEGQVSALQAQATRRQAKVREIRARLNAERRRPD